LRHEHLLLLLLWLLTTLRTALQYDQLLRLLLWLLPLLRWPVLLLLL
jgi:hypothetical protein